MLLRKNLDFGGGWIVESSFLISLWMDYCLLEVVHRKSLSFPNFYGLKMGTSGNVSSRGWGKILRERGNFLG